MDLIQVFRTNWDRCLGWAALALGCLAIWLGWLGISKTALTYEQAPYILSGGFFGLALIGLGSTLLLSADLRDEWRKLERLESAILSGGLLHDANRSGTGRRATEAADTPVLSSLVAAEVAQPR